jgi:hypothetical protein
MSELKIEDLEPTQGEPGAQERREQLRTLELEDLRMVTGGECVATYSDNACACDAIV